MNALKKFCRLLNTNFKKGDLHIILTHGKDRSEEEADRLTANFLERVRRYRRRHKMSELKWMLTTERNNRLHHHVIMNKMSMDVLAKLWGKGIIKFSPLEDQKDFKGLAFYVLKEMEVSRNHKKAWRQSRNLEKPTEIIKQLKSRKQAERKVRTPKGYKCTRQYFDYYEEIGFYQYYKFVEMDGVDFADPEEEVSFETS
jgi:hypothetical protein